MKNNTFKNQLQVSGNLKNSQKPPDHKNKFKSKLPV